MATTGLTWPAAGVDAMTTLNGLVRSIAGMRSTHAHSMRTSRARQAGGMSLRRDVTPVTGLLGRRGMLRPVLESQQLLAQRRQPGALVARLLPLPRVAGEGEALGRLAVAPRGDAGLA